MKGSFINFCITEKDLSYSYNKCRKNKTEYDNLSYPDYHLVLSPFSKALKRIFNNETNRVIKQKGNYLLIQLNDNYFTLFHPNLDVLLWHSIFAVEPLFNLHVDYTGKEITWAMALEYAKKQNVLESFTPIVLPETHFSK